MNRSKLEEEVGKTADAVFLHGRETPGLSMNLPEGQLTVAEATDKLMALFSQHLSSLQKEIEGVKIEYTKDERVVAKKIGMLPQVIEHETWFNQGVDAVLQHLAQKREEER